MTPIPPKPQGNNPLSKIKLRRAVYPILIGLAVVGYMFYRDFDSSVFEGVELSLHTVLWLLVAVLFMVLRDLGYMARLRVLAGREMTWLQSFRVIMLWEFTSAITPSAVGGTGFAIIYVHKEGVGIGRSSAIVMLTSFLDELFFIIMFPLLIFSVGASNIFDITASDSVLMRSLMAFAVVGYSFKLIYTVIISYGLFINPRGLKWLLMKVFRWRPLRRWYRAMNNIGTDMVNSSKEIRHQRFGYWFKVVGATFVSWCSRFLVANALIMAFFSVTDHFLLFARQLVMWVMMLVMPTPGGSGFAEVIFKNYCADMIVTAPGMQIAAAVLIATLWRGVTYYPYLAIGAVIFPRWVRSKFGTAKKSSKESV